MSEYFKQILFFSAIFVLLVISIGVAVYLVQPQLSRTAEKAYSSVLSTATYSEPIPYNPPPLSDRALIGNCGIYSELIVPSANQSDYTNNTVPIGVPVELLLYGIFNDTSTCALPKSLNVAFIVSGTFSSSVRVSLVVTSGNNSVYGGALTFTSLYSPDIVVALLQVPSGVHNLVGFSFHFNMGPIGSLTPMTHINDTTFTVTMPQQHVATTNFSSQVTFSATGTASYVGTLSP